MKKKNEESRRRDKAKKLEEKSKIKMEKVKVEKVTKLKKGENDQNTMLTK